MSWVCPQPPPPVPATEDIVPTGHRLSDELLGLVDGIVETVSPADATFASVVRPLVDLENRQAPARAIIHALRYAAPDRETQHTVEQYAKIESAMWAAFGERLGYFRLLQAVQDRGDPLLDGDEEWRRTLERKLRAFTLRGHGTLADPADLQAWAARNQTISDLCAQCNQNLREYEGGLWVAEADLDGLPASELAKMPRGEGGEHAPTERFVSLTGRAGRHLLGRVHSPATRQRVMQAEYSKVPANGALLQQVALLRDANARMLGLASHAAYRLPFRLPDSTEAIDRFLHELGDQLVPLGVADMEELRGVKAAAAPTPSSADADVLLPWDVAYYRSVQEAGAAVDQDAIAEYFPLRHTVGVMLQLFARYLQLHFEPVPAAALQGHVWADDVEVWSVWDQRPPRRHDSDHGFVGYLYVDLLERPNKYRHNQCVNLRPGYAKPDGSRVYPATTLMCYFPRATPTSTPLLKHRDVITLFHELGHGMHDLLARTKYHGYHGYAVCPEFGEAIGMMLEHWCWLPDQLQAMSRHYTRLDPKYADLWKLAHKDQPLPPETIPDAMLEGLIKRRSIETLRQSLKQLTDSTFDMAIHNPQSHDQLQHLDLPLTYLGLVQKFELRQNPKGSHDFTSIGHYTAGYDACYYAYLSANVIAADFFQDTFSDGRHTSPDAWNRFREGILQHGGSKKERLLLEKYLGRPESPQAFVDRITQGLAEMDKAKRE